MSYYRDYDDGDDYYDDGEDDYSYGAYESDRQEYYVASEEREIIESATEDGHSHGDLDGYGLWKQALGPRGGSGSRENYHGEGSSHRNYSGDKSSSITAYYPNNNNSSSYQQTSRTTMKDTQTGSYSSTTVRKNCSSGDVFKERGTGRVGYKDEYKATFEHRVGDKRGYTEYHLQGRVRRVDFGCNSGKVGHKRKKLI